MTDREPGLDRQIETLLTKGYPALAGLDEAAFTTLLDPLRALLLDVEVSEEARRLPLLLVVPHTLVPTVAAVERFEVRGQAGWTDMADEIGSYRPIEGVEAPGEPYLLLDVSTGPETLSVPPGDALPMIRGAGRTPLTVDEGVALVTQLPESLTEHNAFQALGSRADNRRVPSFWMSKGAPRLGWCWEGNPHTWLGSASAARRLGAP